MTPRSPAASPGCASRRPGALLAALAAAGIEARFVGGCVRDALLGRPAADRRHRHRDPGAARGVAAALEAAGIKAVPTGIAHGTVTAVVGRRGISRSRRCAAMSRPSAGARASPSPPTGRPTRRGATSPSTRCSSTPTARVHDPVGGLADLAARPRALRRRPGDAHRRGRAAAAALLPLRGAVRSGRRRCRRARRLPRRRHRCCRRCRPSGWRASCCGCSAAPDPVRGAAR